MDALFFSTKHRERNSLAQQLQCEFDERDVLLTNDHRETAASGVFGAGDLLGEDVQMMVLAMGQGAAAAIRLNQSLIREQLASDGIRLSTELGQNER